jgi:hypothetical protein
MYQRQPDGSRTWSDNLGTAPLQMHAVADIGRALHVRSTFCL